MIYGVNSNKKQPASCRINLYFGTGAYTPFSKPRRVSPRVAALLFLVRHTGGLLEEGGGGGLTEKEQNGKMDLQTGAFISRIEK